MLSYNESDGKEEQNRSAKHLASLFFVLSACFPPRLAIAFFFLLAALHGSHFHQQKKGRPLDVLAAYNAAKKIRID